MEQTRIEVLYEQRPCYDILLEQDYKKLGQKAGQAGLNGRRICIVTDSNTRIYAETVRDALKECASQISIFTFPAGEQNKNLETVGDLYAFLIQEGFDRNDALAALGGGVVGDLTGFTAATYLRGIRFFQLPTSLLSMVDSSIGGKTGVDFKAYKNMVGAFYMPLFVYMNMSVLDSLPEREYISGFGEIIKHGLIKDAPFYEWLKTNMKLLSDRNPLKVTEMVYKSLLVKKEVVEKDPKEKGERALLNFGHTLGHAVEKLKGFSLLHGECVSIGMAAAAYISFQRGLLAKNQLQDILDTLKSARLPVCTDGLETKDILEAASKDKKMDAGKIKFVLLKQIGSAYIDTSVTVDEMAAACGVILSEKPLVDLPMDI